MERVSGIYKITSQEYPDRIYIGSAKDTIERWWLHLSALRKNIHHSGKLQNHYNKYGEADLTFEVMFVCPLEELILREQEMLDQHMPYFNICKIAGSSLGLKRSQETKDKISLAKRNPSQETRDRISKAKQNPSQELRDKISKSLMGNIPWNKGKSLSDEHVENLRKSHVGQVPWNKGLRGKSKSESRVMEDSDMDGTLIFEELLT